MSLETHHVPFDSLELAPHDLTPNDSFEDTNLRSIPSIASRIASLDIATISAVEEVAIGMIERLPQKVINDGMYIRKRFPQLSVDDARIIGNGAHTIVFRIPEECTLGLGRWAIKCIGFAPDPDDSSLICLEGAPIRRGDPFALSDTVDLLHSLKISVVPPHREACASIGMVRPINRESDRSVRFVVCPDLTWGGDYKVCEAYGFNFNSLKNGDELQNQFISYVYDITCLGAHPDYSIIIDKHKELGDFPEIAVSKMFMVVIDPYTNIGELVPTDFDHISIYNNQKHNVRSNILNDYTATPESLSTFPDLATLSPTIKKVILAAAA